MRHAPPAVPAAPQGLRQVAPHLKLQLLAELCDQALKLTVKFAVLSLQIGSLLLLRVIGGRLSASVRDRRLLCLTLRKLLLNLCD